VNRFLNWWALPLYALGLGLATAAPFFTDSHSNQIALNFLLLASFYGWAVYRFKSRFWLLTALLATHLSLGFYLDTLRLVAERGRGMAALPAVDRAHASQRTVHRKATQRRLAASSENVRRLVASVLSFCSHRYSVLTIGKLGRDVRRGVDFNYQHVDGWCWHPSGSLLY
jgi:hypothetical protein